MTQEPSTAERELGAAMAQLAGEFTELVRVMTDPQPDGLRATRVVKLAAESVPGSEHAGITLINGSKEPETIASTGELPIKVDQVQYDTGEGPCLQALVENDIVWSGDLATDDQWPRFGPRAVQDTGVRSMVSFRLFLPGQHRGALNFYSLQPRAFDDLAVSIGAIFASYASITLLSSLHSDRAMNLERALETNREIGVAIGILMTRQLTTREQAFEELRVASQHLNLKLRDVAQEVILTGDLPA
jgi:ANTAR domain-containing protein/GAF domain-containing protein